MHAKSSTQPLYNYQQLLNRFSNARSVKARHFANSPVEKPIRKFLQHLNAKVEQLKCTVRNKNSHQNFSTLQMRKRPIYVICIKTGVFIVQPQGVSDDEGQEVKPIPNLGSEIVGENGQL